MSIFIKDRGEVEKPPVTEDIFLVTLAARICEKVSFDLDEVGKIQSALSNLYNRQITVKDSRYKTNLDFFTALKEENKDYASLVKSAQEDIISTFKKTHECSPRMKFLRRLKGQLVRLLAKKFPDLWNM